MKHMAILTDVTRCIGCEECVTACQTTHETGEDAPFRWQGGTSELSSTRWTTIATTSEGRFVRVHCRHCLDPGCAAACPVAALKVTDTGAVAYDAEGDRLNICDLCGGEPECVKWCPEEAIAL